MPYVLGKVKRTVDGDPVADVADVDGALSQSEVDARAQLRVDALEANAPAALDTLNELAEALGDDADYAATVTTALAGKAAKNLSNVEDDSVTPGMLDADSTAEKTAFRTRIGVAASDFSGSYDDLTDQPTIPALSSATPQSPGTASAGTASSSSRSNHRHARELNNDAVTPGMLDADSTAEKTAFRTRIAAGESDFSGSYDDLSDQPTILSQAQVDARAQLRVDALEANAPAALDTLNELAAALGDDANYAAGVTTVLAGKAATSLSNVSQNTTVAGRVKALLELLSGDSRLDGSAIKNVIPPTAPQSAFLENSNPGTTWHDVLDYTSGGGFLHYCVAVTGAQFRRPDFRITVDGTASTLAYDHDQVDGEMGGSTGTDQKVRRLRLNVRFEQSLKVEVKINHDDIEAKVLYSTEI